MDTTRRDAEAKLKHALEEVALELDTAAAAARSAAKRFENPAEAWTDVQQLLTRFEQATHLMAEFRREIDTLAASAATPEDAARLAAISRVPPK